MKSKAIRAAVMPSGRNWWQIVMFYLRDLPTYEDIKARKVQYPQVDPGAIECCLVMLRVATDVLSGWDAYLGRKGISAGRFSIMMLLNRDPHRPFSPSELAEKIGVTRATITGLLDGLERAKYVRRDEHPNDRRGSLIHLTPKGRKMLDGMLPDYYTQMCKLMAGLKPEDKKQLTQFMWKVNEGVAGLYR